MMKKDAANFDCHVASCLCLSSGVKMAPAAIASMQSLPSASAQQLKHPAASSPIANL